MTELVEYEAVDQKTAAKLAALYVGSFANQPHNAAILLRQVGQWCLGKPAAVLQHMVDPTHGAVAKSDRPCLKSLNKWFEDWTGRDPAPKAIPDFRPEPDEPQEPLEVRKAAVDRWRKVKPLIGAAVDSNCVGRPKGWKPSQKEHSLSELMARTEQ